MMSARRWEYLFLKGMLIAIFWMLPEIVSANEHADRNGFCLGGSIGYGHINVQPDNVSRTSNGSFALSLRGGHTITSMAVVGLELNGWTIKSFDINNPSKGESVSNVSIFLNFFPTKRLPLYIAGGVGRLSYTNNSPQVDGRDNGGSWFVGSGYEVPVSNRLNVVPQVRYSQGNFKNGNFKVYELTIGMNWYSGR